MRSFSDSALRPLNTTQWIAPMRAHASMLIASWGTMGMYSTTRSPFSHAEAAEHVRRLVHLAMQTLVSVDVHLFGGLALPDERGFCSCAARSGGDRCSCKMR